MPGPSGSRGRLRRAVIASLILTGIAVVVAAAGAAIRTIVEPQILRIAWGKLMLVGTRRPRPAPPL